MPPPAEGSAEVAARVANARDIQRARYDGHAIRTNAEAEGEMLDRVATPDAAGAKLLTEAADTMRLTARGYHRVLRVARTIADLAGAIRRAARACGGSAFLPPPHASSLARRNFRHTIAFHSLRVRQRGKISMLRLILLIVLILALLGSVPMWGYSAGWGYGPSGGLGLVLVVVLILILMGRL